MSRIVLLPFQQQAADALVESAVSYYSNKPDRLAGRDVPFVGNLKAVTGAGKTPVLTHGIGKLGPSIVLWTTTYGSVADQTHLNLSPGGKYHHLFATSDVEVRRLADVPSYPVWREILQRDKGVTVLISTVAAWNSSEKDERLNVHRVHEDWGQTSRWQQLKEERRRKLWVVYDEAHNSTTEQVDLLDDLDPAGFFVAGASPIKGRLQQYLSNYTPEVRDKRIISIKTVDVVDAELLKSSIVVADYESGPDEMLRDVVKRRGVLEEALKRRSSRIVPKAIYVVESSRIRPIEIWRTLTGKCKVPAESVAICTDTPAKDFPDGAIRITSVHQLSDQHSHIIFNKKLQEGWDDPSVYVCYLDGTTESGTRVQQVVGRALRQPDGRHFPSSELNSAYVFLNCPSAKMEKIVDELKQELRIYKDADAPENWEPFEFKEARKALSKIPLKRSAAGLRVPKLQPQIPRSDRLTRLLVAKTLQFSPEDCRSPGRALIDVVSMRTGQVTRQTRDLLEDMRVKCGAYLQEQIRKLSRGCLNAMNPTLFANGSLNRTACYNSKALSYYRELAVELVKVYEDDVQLALLSDTDDRLYSVNEYQPSGAIFRSFAKAAHAKYDASAFNEDELEIAKALDKFPFVWARNKARLDYGIPLPAKSGGSSTFYPDFLWWVQGVVWAIDPTGKHILDEKIRTKLLTTPEPLRIALLTPGKLDHNFKLLDKDGWTLLRSRLGNPNPQPFDSAYDMLEALTLESPRGKRTSRVSSKKARGRKAVR